MFDDGKLKVTFAPGTLPDGPIAPRRYTLTHSDRTGQLFLTIGAEYDGKALRSLQVRLERDEVLGEWVISDGRPRLELHMTAQAGLPIFGTAAVRRRIFHGYRSLVLAALEHAERDFTGAGAHPELVGAPVVARFHWRRGREDRESWGTWGKADAATSAQP